MKKWFLILAVILCINHRGITQSIDSDTLKSAYTSLFQVLIIGEKGKEFVAYFPNNKLDKSNIYANLTNDNILYLDYILENYSSINRDKLNQCRNDSVKLREVFFKDLRNDNVLEKNLNSLVYWYLQSKKPSSIASKVVISKELFFTTASRFFHAVKIKPDSSIYFKVCVGHNGFIGQKPASDIMPLVEAFCFMTVMNFVESNENPYYNEYKVNAKKFSKEDLNLSIEERLQTIRQKMYQRMASNKHLQNILLSEYEKKETMLGFIVQ